MRLLSVMTNFETLKESLSRHGQEHLLRFWEELSDSERKQLISDIQELNLAEVNSFFKRATASLQESSEKLDDRLKPVPEETFMSISRTNKDLLKIYEDEGEDEREFFGKFERKNKIFTKIDLRLLFILKCVKNILILIEKITYIGKKVKIE